MDEIKRYESDMYGPYEVDEGRFVIYEDHIAIVEKLKAEIQCLQAENTALNDLNLELEADVRYWKGHSYERGEIE